MNLRHLMLLAAATLAATNLSCAGNGARCDDKLLSALHECERIVGSLRPDKAGQRRVFASDGSMFTADQANWMKQQLQRIDRACVDGDRAAASQLLATLQALLKEHQPAS